MPMLPDEVKVNALRKEREYYMEQAEKCEAQLPEYDVEFMFLESERDAPDDSCACLESCPEESDRAPSAQPSRAPTVQLWSTSGAALWKLGASSRAPSVQSSEAPTVQPSGTSGIIKSTYGAALRTRRLIGEYLVKAGEILAE